MKRGIYETLYGNAAYVSGRKDARTAFDLDGGVVVPMEMVTQKFIRKAEPQDANQAAVSRENARGW